MDLLPDLGEVAPHHISLQSNPFHVEQREAPSCSPSSLTGSCLLEVDEDSDLDDRSDEKGVEIKTNKKSHCIVAKVIAPSLDIIHEASDLFYTFLKVKIPKNTDEARGSDRNRKKSSFT